MWQMLLLSFNTQGGAEAGQLLHSGISLFPRASSHWQVAQDSKFCHCPKEEGR